MEEEPVVSMSDLYYLLLADLSDTSTVVENARRNANENYPRQSWASLMEAYKNGHCDPHNLLSLFKKKAIEAMNKEAGNVMISGEPIQSAAISLELRSKLLQKVAEDRLSIQQMTNELSQLQNTNKEILRKTEEIKEIIVKRSTSGEMKTDVDWEEVQKNLKATRAKYVKDIDVFKKMLSGKDPYTDVTDSSPEDVEFLLQCHLLVRHPHNCDLVRLSDTL